MNKFIEHINDVKVYRMIPQSLFKFPTQIIIENYLIVFVPQNNMRLIFITDIGNPRVCSSLHLVPVIDYIYFICLVTIIFTKYTTCFYHSSVFNQWICIYLDKATFQNQISPNYDAWEPLNHSREYGFASFQISCQNTCAHILAWV